MSATLDIGEVVKRSGLPASTLHLWERKGLIEPCGRAGLRRQYDADVLDHLAVIVVCQEAGFTLAEISQILAPEAFASGKELLSGKLEELQRKRHQLEAAIAGIEHALACPNPTPLECDGFRTHLDDVLPVERFEQR